MRPSDALVTGFFFTIGAACAAVILYELFRLLATYLPALLPH
jgi:hypothetical protein